MYLISQNTQAEEILIPSTFTSLHFPWLLQHRSPNTSPSPRHINQCSEPHRARVPDPALCSVPSLTAALQHQTPLMARGVLQTWHWSPLWQRIKSSTSFILALRFWLPVPRSGSHQNTPLLAPVWAGKDGNFSCYQSCPTWGKTKCKSIPLRVFCPNWSLQFQGFKIKYFL